jgi:serine protease
MPTTSSYDGRGYTSGNAETVTITNPVAGDFHRVQAYSTFSGVTLKAVHSARSRRPTSPWR